jgi:hypothetical protein
LNRCLTGLLELSLHRGHAPFGGSHVLHQLGVGMGKLINLSKLPSDHIRQARKRVFRYSCNLLSLNTFYLRGIVILRRSGLVQLGRGQRIAGVKLCGLLVPKLLHLVLG